MTRLLLCFVAAQVTMLPLFALYLWIVPRRAGLRFQWTLHRVLFALSILLPMALLPRWPVAAPAAAGAVIAQVQRAFPVAAPAAAPARGGGSVLTGPSPRSGRTMPLGLLWMVPGVGTAAFAVRLARQKAREGRLVRRGGGRRFGRVEVVVSAEVRVPFSTGFLRPRVFLPAALGARPAARQMVVRHEAIHLRRAHWLWTAGEALAASLLWPSPFMHLLAKGGGRIREMICDQAACRRVSRVEYGRLLVETAQLAARRGPSLADAWVRQGFLRERIALLVREGRIVMKWNARVVSVLTAALFAGFLAAAVPFLTPAGAQATAHGLFPLVQPWTGAMPVKDSSSITVTASSTIVMRGSMVLGGPDDGMLYPDQPGSATMTMQPAQDVTAWPAFSGRILLNADRAGTPALATADAFISSVSSGLDGTWTVTLLTGGYRIVYRHLDAVRVKEGDAVQEGDQVGTLAAGTRSDPGAFFLEYEVWSGDTMIFPIGPGR